MTRGMLEVLVVEGKCIKHKNNHGYLNCLMPWNHGKLIDPYVSIQFGDQKHSSDVARGEGNKLIWNEKFKFNVEYPSGDHDKDHTYNKLIFRIIDKHSHRHRDYVGETTIYVKDILTLGEENGKTDLEATKYKVVQSDKTYNGQISVAVNFTLGV